MLHALCLFMPITCIVKMLVVVNFSPFLEWISIGQYKKVLKILQSMQLDEIFEIDIISPGVKKAFLEPR